MSLPEPTPDGGAHAKAWKEMGPRYLAATLGSLILLMAIISWKIRRSPRLATAIVALVVFQAMLGKWTVTMLLRPSIVTAHLLWGIAILALLLWFALSHF